MKKHSRILILALCCALLFSTGVLAADSVKKTIEATYRGIKLVVDGVPVTPKDANGSVVEPFISNGTTYLPVRAVGEALGKTVKWDGATSTVYIGNVSSEDIYLMDVCPPYETFQFKNPEYFTMMGKEYFHGFILYGYYGHYPEDAYAYFNLNGEYASLEFDFGHIDGTTMASASFSVYLDGEYLMTIEGNSDMIVQHISIPLDYALQMKIVCSYTGTWDCANGYGFANVTLTE